MVVPRCQGSECTRVAVRAQIDFDIEVLCGITGFQVYKRARTDWTKHAQSRHVIQFSTEFGMSNGRYRV
ncbi:hypothetical protein F01_260296 [Burkholderia cenocepacia]|nr:hypothetical protein F01_260296 [Burkholderia cenocepacia]